MEIPWNIVIAAAVATLGIFAQRRWPNSFLPVIMLILVATTIAMLWMSFA